MKEASIICQCARLSKVMLALIVLSIPGVIPVKTAQRIVPSITLSPTSGPAGTTFTISGSSFTPYASVDIRWGKELVTTVRADTNGTFRISVPVPAVAPGSYNVTATDTELGGVATATFTVMRALTASATPASSTVTVDVSVTFTVNASGGTKPYSYQWYEETTLLSGQTSSTLSISKSVAGTYRFYCRVTDAGGQTADSNAVTLTVTDFSMSASPASQSVFPGQSTTYTVTLTGSGGFSQPVSLTAAGVPTGASSSFSPGTVTPTSSGVTSTLTIQTGSSTPAATSTLTITGTAGTLSHFTTVQLAVLPPPLTASATPATRTVPAGQSATYSVTASGGMPPYTYQWYEGTTPIAGQTSTQLAITKNTAGNYTFYCKVTDSMGQTAKSNTVTLTVRALVPPAAQIISVSPNPGKVDQPITFTFTGNDSDGVVTRYEWNWGDGTPLVDGILGGNGVPLSISHSYKGSGTFTASLSVMDNQGAWSNPVSALLEVRQSQPPRAVIDSPLPGSITVGQQVTFSGHGDSAEGVIIGYRWTSSIDGLLSTSSEFSISSLSIGSHTITFQVQDSSGAWSDEETAILEVKEATTLLWPLPLIGGFAVATAAVSLIHFSRPPSSTEVKQDLRKQRDREAKKEEKDREKGRPEIERGKPFLDLKTDSPPRIMGATSYEARLKVRNIGSREAKDVTVTADCTPGLLLDKQVEGIPSLEPGGERLLVFPFRVSEQVRKGVYTLRFEVRSRETWKQVRNRYARAVKIGLLSNAEKQENVQPLREWLRGKSYTYDELTSADHLVRCLLKYDLIILAPELELPQQWMRNLASFVENSQSLLVIDKMITSEEKLLAELLGYDEMRYETFKSGEGLLRIRDNEHFITRELALGEGIQLGQVWGNACMSKLTIGKSLIEHYIREESKNAAVIPALTINEFTEGKTVHLNFHAEKSLSQLSLIVEKTVDWLLLEDIVIQPKAWSSGLRSLKLAPATLTELFQNILRKKGLK